MAIAHRRAGSGPVQSGEVAVVKQEGGAGLWGGRGLTERWVRGGSARKGPSYPEVVTEERREASFVAGVPADLSSPSYAKPRPGLTTMDQANSMALPLLMLRMLCPRKVLYRK